MQVIGDMIINNESRIARSRVVSFFNKARQYSLNVALRWATNSVESGKNRSC